MTPSPPELRIWARRLLSLAVLVAAFFVGSRLSAAEAGEPWVGYLEWRSERIVVRSDCGRVAGGGILRELEAGYQRAARDVADLGLTIPPLGEPGYPYEIRLSRDPGCPGGAIACSTTPHAAAPRWGTVKALCGRDVPKLRRGVRALDHERQHAYCLRLRPLAFPPRTLAELREVPSICARADHPAPGGGRYDVIGRTRP